MSSVKKHTSKTILKAIAENPQESRKEWMLRIFKQAGDKNSRNVNYQFWRQDNQPKIIYTPKFAAQKLEYIHNNPVEAGLVEKAEEYIIPVQEITTMERNAGADKNRIFVIDYCL